MAVYLDTETTGLGADAEIVEITIIDDDGAVLLDSLVRPVRHDAWPEAQAIHHITPEMVKDAPTHEALRDRITACLTGRDVVIYNADYDSQYLSAELSHAVNVHCCMLEFAEYYGEWNEHHGDYKWQSLVKAARYILHEWQGTAHRSLADTQATRAVWHFLHDPQEKERIEAHWQAIEQWQEAECEINRQERHVRYLYNMKGKQITGFLERWWLGKSTDKRWQDSLSSRDVIEAYSWLFFGASTDLLALEDSADTIYRRKKDIPDHLVPLSHYKHYGSWFTKLLKPSGSIFLGKKTGWELYDTAQFEQIRERFPLRLADPEFDTDTEMLVSKTEAKTKQINIEGLSPVLELCTAYGDWYYLYKVPRETENA